MDDAQFIPYALRHPIPVAIVEGSVIGQALMHPGWVSTSLQSGKPS